MARTGLVAQIFSKALHVDIPELYSVGYLDLGQVKEVSLVEFLKLSENFEVIPASRIIHIKKQNMTLYSKSERN